MRCLLVIALLLATCACAAQTVEYVHTDSLGSPVAITNQAGQVIERMQYEPFGALTNNANGDRPGYTGHVMDSLTLLTYMQQRYYDPAIGRFLSTDPVQANANTGASFNRYWYANNNPYKFTDPDGRDTWAIGGGGSASWLGGATAQGQLTFSYQSWDPKTWRLGVVGSVGGTAGTDLGMSAGIAISHSEADSAEEMSESGGIATAGGSVNFAGASVGYEQSICAQCKPIRTLLVGGKLTVLPVEIHTTLSKSWGKTLVGTSPVLPNVVVGPFIPDPEIQQQPHSKPSPNRPPEREERKNPKENTQ